MLFRSQRKTSRQRENHETLGAAGKFLLSDLFHNTGNEHFDLIVSNPPYIPTDVIATLSDDVRLFDPLMALDGKEDGLFFYRRIIAEAPKHLQDGGHLVCGGGGVLGQVHSWSQGGSSLVCGSKQDSRLTRA